MAQKMGSKSIGSYVVHDHQRYVDGGTTDEVPKLQECQIWSVTLQMAQYKVKMASSYHPYER